MPAWQRALSDRVAADIVLTWIVAAATYLVVAVDAPAAIRIAVAGPALFVLPGYVLVATLFPHRGPAAASGHLSSPSGLDRVTTRERFALAFGLSLAILPVLGILIAVSPWGFSESTIALTFLAFVGLGGLLAAVVRRRLPPEDRFHVPLDRWAAEARAAFWGGSPVDRVLNLLLIASVLVALLAVGGAFAIPQDGQTFTDFAVLTENDDGDLVAGGYPDDLPPGESASLVTAVENHEDEPTEYTVVVTMERVEGAGDGDASEGASGGGRDATVTERVELQRYTDAVDPGERWTHRHELEPAISGSSVRVHYYLYRGEAPSDPDATSAYRHLYFWLSADDGDA